MTCASVPMSRRRNRKSRLYNRITELDGRDLRELSGEDLFDAKGLLAYGYLEYDDGVSGMVVRMTDDGRSVIDGE